MTQGGARGKNLGHLSKVLFYIVSNHLLENIHIEAFGTIHGRHPVDSSRHWGPYSRVGLEEKIKDIFVIFFYRIICI